MVVATIPEDILAIIFMSIVTLFMWMGHTKQILLLELCALCVMIGGLAWTLQSVFWPIPLMFALGNLIIFIMDAAGAR